VTTRSPKVAPHTEITPPILPGRVAGMSFPLYVD